MSSPDVGELEEQFVLGALRSGWVAPLGPDVDAFEEEMAARVGVDHAVALSSGTAALHLALLSHGIGDGDIVLTSSMTFAATANAIRYTGAQPYFIDSDASGNISVDLLEKASAQLADSGRPARAIVPVDLLGKVCDFDGINRVAEKYGLFVIADAAESLGASRDGKAAASFGNAAIVSFNGNKIMTTSGGGMLLTDSEDVAKNVRYLATQARQPVAHYEHVDIGYNYRMSNLLAALGRAQLLRLEAMIEKRRKHRAAYRAFFQDFPGVELFGGGNDHEDNCWLTSIVVDPVTAGFTSTQLADFLSVADIEARPLWKPMHLQPVFDRAERMVDGTSEEFFRNGLTLPSGSALADSQVDRIFDRLSSFLVKAR
ncbi:DegT/DnrJ/EryC1/StrS family aminotransferase [Pseudarthrobacter sp. NPDC055928]|uniref:DegT/DnrJ/EryC1/StrS family aminotransferase n=1 Tax=Pseudarthrobacter sp. NPDC055928 TaxID=3345661 RepID=UPI0035E15C64